MTFKEEARLIKQYANEYNKSKIIELRGLDLFSDVVCERGEIYIDSQDKYTYYYNLQNKIDLALDKLDWDECYLLKREFFSGNKHSNWWLAYYSRSTYYRIKKKAMDNFLGLIYE